MTSNQIEYAKLREMKRANVAKEALQQQELTETARSHRATEALQSNRLEREVEQFYDNLDYLKKKANDEHNDRAAVVIKDYAALANDADKWQSNLDATLQKIANDYEIDLKDLQQKWDLKQDELFLQEKLKAGDWQQLEKARKQEKELKTRDQIIQEKYQKLLKDNAWLMSGSNILGSLIKIAPALAGG
jgi:hypothetical protein